MARVKTFRLGMSVGGVLLSLLAGCGNDDKAATKDEVAVKGDSDDSTTDAEDAGNVEESTNVDEPPDVDTMLNTYDATDERISVVARSEATSNGPRFSSAGGYMTVHFQGTTISVSFVDQSNGRASYDAWLDGEPVAKVVPVTAMRKYPVASGLTAGEHTLVFSKRTEASIGSVTLLSVEIAGTLLTAPKPAHRIEFIGDSITAGAGVDAANGTDACSDANWGLSNNAAASYGAVAARALDADYHLTAVSGIGLVRNYSAMYDARPMPEVYDLLNLESMTSAQWDHDRFVPDVVVVALGTNDFSPGDNPPEDPRPQMEVEPYTQEYIEFVDRLRGVYPEADIFGISSPMLGDGWPDSTYTSKTNLLTTLENVAEHYRDSDPKVHTFVVESLAGAGCGTHPDVAQHQRLGEALATEIRSVLGW